MYPVFSLKNKRKQQPDVSPIDSAAVRKIRQEDLGFKTSLVLHEYYISRALSPKCVCVCVCVCVCNHDSIGEKRLL